MHIFENSINSPMYSKHKPQLTYQQQLSMNTWYSIILLIFFFSNIFVTEIKFGIFISRIIAFLSKAYIDT